MTLDKFEYVLALAEEKSMTKAAKRLYISQPGLTAYINKLEQYLGIRLFDRSVTPIQVTEAGMIYISKMKQIQKDEALLRMKLHDMSSKKRVFRIGMGMTRGMQWLPILLPRFYQLHPDIVLQVQEGGLEDLENGVSSGNLDIAFGALNTGYPGVVYEVIRKEQIYCIFSRKTSVGSQFLPTEATLDHPMVIDGHELNEMRFLMPSPSNGFFHFTSQLMRNYNIAPLETMTLSNLDTAYQLAAHGIGALFINALDFHRIHPELDEKLAFCCLEDSPVYRLSLIGYQEHGENLDLIEDIRKLIHEDLLPLL